MKRILAFLLAMLMMVGTPVAVLANEAAPVEPIELVVETPAEEPVEEESTPEESLTEQVEEEVIEEPIPEEMIEEPVTEEEIFVGEWEEIIVPKDTVLPENEKLFEAYVQMLLDESIGSYELQGELAGSQLNPLDKTIYDNLKSSMLL